MAQDSGCPVTEGPTVVRLDEEDWRVWRDVRLAALADAPVAFGTTIDEARAVPEEGWRAMIRDAAIFIATGRRKPFPGDHARRISEMSLPLHGRAPGLVGQSATDEFRAGPRSSLVTLHSSVRG